MGFLKYKKRARSAKDARALAIWPKPLAWWSSPTTTNSLAESKVNGYSVFLCTCTKQHNLLFKLSQFCDIFRGSFRSATSKPLNNTVKVLQNQEHQHWNDYNIIQATIRTFTYLCIDCVHTSVKSLIGKEWQPQLIKSKR